MEIAYDREADALAVELVPEGRTARMIRITPDVTADLDAKGRLLSIEVLDASSFYPLRDLERLGTGESWLTLAAAAVESGLQHGTLRVLVHAGKFPSARKRGRDWEISSVELADYLANRSSVGRPPKTRRPKARTRA